MIANPMRGWVNPTTIPARTLYRCANVRAQAIPLLIDVEPSNAFRAPGIMEGTFGYESALDELAAALSLDPLDLRRANDVDVDQVSGLPYSAKNLSACIDRAAELAGWAERDALRDREHADGRSAGPRRRLPDLVGRRRPAGARARAHGPRRRRHGRDGRAGHRHGRDDGVRAWSPPRSSGCRSTACASRSAPRATASTRPVSGGSQTMPSVAPAVRSAAYDLRGKLLELAGDVFEVSPDDLQHRRRRVRLARRRAARAGHRGHGQARPGAARRHRLARPESGRHAREHVRLPDRAGRGRCRDGRDHGRAHRRGARHRPRDLAAAGAQPGRGRRAAGPRLRAHGGARRSIRRRARS